MCMFYDLYSLYSNVKDGVPHWSVVGTILKKTDFVTVILKSQFPKQTQKQN